MEIIQHAFNNLEDALSNLVLNADRSDPVS